MVLLVSDEVRRKSGGPRMVVTGFANGMVECRWYDGYGVKREAFREDELIRGGREAEPLLTRYQRPAFVGRFHINGCFTNRERG
jgi:uncharacterized protein YodC (DUF2158 family)